MPSWDSSDGELSIGFMSGVFSYVGSQLRLRRWEDSKGFVLICVLFHNNLSTPHTKG